MRRPIVIALALALTADAVSAAVLCTTRSGQLVVRERCRKRERPVDVAGVSQPGAAGEAGPAGAAGRSPLRVLDAGGTEVTLLRLQGPANDFVLLTHPLLGAPSWVRVTRQGSLDGQVFHASSDCSGEVYLRRPPSGFVLEAQVVADVVYRPGAGSEVAAMGSLETSVDSGGGSVQLPGGTWCRAQSFTGPFVPAESAALSAVGVTLPLHAERR